MADRKLEYMAGELLRSQGLTLSVAESCTGGLLGHRLTNVPGSSDYFVGGVVAYSYAAKERLLSMDHATLVEHGAVSEQIALDMARSVRHMLQTDLSMAITGIAGPGGAMPGKPVGLVFVALAAQDAEVCRRFVWHSDREGNKALSAQAALDMLVEYLRQRTTDERQRKQPAMGNAWYGNEPVIVESRFLAGGNVQPTTFDWRGRSWIVTGLGRQWDEADGRHVLVVTSDGSRFELCLTTHASDWRLLRAWEQTYAT